VGHDSLLVAFIIGNIVQILWTAFVVGRFSKEHALMWDWFKKTHINGKKESSAV